MLYMSRELNFGPYVDVENGKKVVRDLTFGNPTPEGIVLTTLDSAVNWMRKSSIWPSVSPLTPPERFDDHRRPRLE
jgi:hypothetical protein